MSVTAHVHDDDYDGTCARCHSARWVSVSLDGGQTRLPQCVPCGYYHGFVQLHDRPVAASRKDQT